MTTDHRPLGRNWITTSRRAERVIKQAIQFAVAELQTQCEMLRPQP
jgi:hypothetical protein